MKKVLVSIIFAFVFFSFINVQALTDAECAADAEAHGGRCGWNMRTCAIDDSGSCVANKYDLELFENENSTNGEVSTNETIKTMSKVNCGNITGIPAKIPELTSFIIKIVYVAAPVILVIMGSIDLFKGLTAQKEDEIKKGQQLFIKRLITAFIIFLIVVLVKLFISIVADSENSGDITKCINCFIDNDCK